MINIQENRNRIIFLLSHVPRIKKDEFIYFLDDIGFFTSPASSAHHSNYEGGLAEHSLKVYETLQKLVTMLNLNEKVKDETIIVTALLHDIGKCGIYKQNKLKSGYVSESRPYVVDDCFPVGHAEKSIMLILPYISLTMQEMMMIRWHMGAYDRELSTYQNAVQEKFPEAYLLYFADHISSLYLEI